MPSCATSFCALISIRDIVCVYVAMLTVVRAVGQFSRISPLFGCGRRTPKHKQTYSCGTGTRLATSHIQTSLLVAHRASQSNNPCTRTRTACDQKVPSIMPAGGVQLCAAGHVVLDPVCCVGFVGDNCISHACTHAQGDRDDADAHLSTALKKNRADPQVCVCV